MIANEELQSIEREEWRINGNSERKKTRILVSGYSVDIGGIGSIAGSKHNRHMEHNR